MMLTSKTPVHLEVTASTETTRFATIAERPSPNRRTGLERPTTSTMSPTARERKAEWSVAQVETSEAVMVDGVTRRHVTVAARKLPEGDEGDVFTQVHTQMR